jgi:voltage-gated potassium channel
MSGKFIDVLYSIVIQFRWKYIALFFLVFFIGSWAAVHFFEPDAEITSPSVYWWYFINNVLRSGYSGYNPQTLGGRIVSIFSFFGGGIFFVATLCKLTATMYERMQKRKKGLSVLNLKDHIVILGYRAGESDQLVRELTADHLKRMPIVLCSRHLDENPLPGMVEFIKGDTASDDVFRRSCASQASVIVINGHTDERTRDIVTVATYSTRQAGRSAHIVAHVEKVESIRYIRMINPSVECVTSLRPMLIAQAVFNPDATALLRELVSFTDPGTNFRIDIPAGTPSIPFWRMIQAFHLNYRAIPVAYTDSHSREAKVYLNPKPDQLVGGGMSLFYIAEHRVDRIIDWEMVCSEPNEEDATEHSETSVLA